MSYEDPEESRLSRDGSEYKVQFKEIFSQDFWNFLRSFIH